jgi:hypothetical protein
MNKICRQDPLNNVRKYLGCDGVMKVAASRSKANADVKEKKRKRKRSSSGASDDGGRKKKKRKQGSIL